MCLWMILHVQKRQLKAVINEHFSKPLAMEKVIEAIGNYSKKITKI